MKLRVWISYCLLASFFVVLTPRSLWHDCDTHVHELNSSNDHSKDLPQLKKKNCFACEFDLGLIDLPGSILSVKHEKTFSPDIAESAFQVFTEEIPFFSKRGPPVVC